MIVIVFAVMLSLLLLVVNSRWERAKQLDGWAYAFGAKVSLDRLLHGPFETDCSGFVTHILGCDRNKLSFELVQENEASYQAVYRLNAETLTDGSLVAYDSGPTWFDGRRKNGVDHIGIVLQGWDGTLYLCDCNGPQGGVKILPLSEGVALWNQFAVDHMFGAEYDRSGKKKCFYVL